VPDPRPAGRSDLGEQRLELGGSHELMLGRVVLVADVGNQEVALAMDGDVLRHCGTHRVKPLGGDHVLEAHDAVCVQLLDQFGD
jgi:hypothetical protein